MHQKRLFGLLLRPSFFSFTVTGALALALLGAANWSKVANSNLFSGYLSLADVLQSAPDGFSAFFDVLFAKTFIYNIIIFIVALLVGLLAYVALVGFERGLAGITGSLSDAKNAARMQGRQAKVEAGARLGARFVTLVGWAVYWVVFLKVAVPFCVLAFRTGIDDLGHIGWGYTLLAFGLLWFCLHLHVVFIRLFLLRPRVFGGEDVIAAGLA
ncbi:MAG TPA: hypothetical protein VMY99_02005 [Nevskiaceae bacterium]|nr:hypothetical protein [Nevskiaceae bacterium]